jgi:hypothetical protein
MKYSFNLDINVLIIVYRKIKIFIDNNENIIVTFPLFSFYCRIY